MPHSLSILTFVLLLSCLLSFAWAMKHFFTHPTGSSFGMRLIKISGIVFGILHVHGVLTTPSDWQYAFAGWAIYCVSLALFWWTLQTNRRTALSAAFSVDTPQHLVTSGPYRYVRHPFYTSYMLAWTAGAVTTQDTLLVASAVFMAAVYWVAAVIEERKFEDSELSAAYRAYRLRTGRFLPDVLKWSAGRVRESVPQ